MRLSITTWFVQLAAGATDTPGGPERVPTPTEALVGVGAGLLAYLVLVACAQMLRRTRDFHFGRWYHLFAGSAALLAGVAASRWNPEWREDILTDMGALMTFSAAIPLVTIVNRILWTRVTPDGKRSDAPRLLAETTGIIIFVVVGLAVMEIFYGKTLPTSMLAGSGVAAFIIGFAMQDLLGNILAGFALYISKPFKIGDWLFVNDHHARVREVTWRSTRLITDDDVVMEVPNADLVKRPIINFHQPHPHHAMRITIGLHYNVPPARAQEVLQEAASTVPGVCPEAPQVYVHHFADSAVVYEVKFWIEDHAVKSRILSEVRSHCWYAVRRAGMEIPFPIVTLHRPSRHDAAAEARAAAAAALRGHAIFSFLSGTQIDDLVQQSRVLLFAKSERLVEQGEEGGSMFLLVQGRVEIRLAHATGDKVLSQLGPGDCLGEMSALTGEKRSATVVAAEEVEAVEITHTAFSSLVRHNPEVVQRLGELLARRQQAIDHRIANPTRAPIPVDIQDSMIRRLKAFFQL